MKAKFALHADGFRMEFQGSIKILKADLSLLDRHWLEVGMRQDWEPEQFPSKVRHWLEPMTNFIQETIVSCGWQAEGIELVDNIWTQQEQFILDAPKPSNASVAAMQQALDDPRNINSALKMLGIPSI